MATIDQQFVEYIVKTLVSNPDKVTIERTIDEKGVLLALTVDPEDVGRVIGRRGATAQSIRTLLRALGTKNDARYNLKIVNTDNFDGESEKTATKSKTTSTKKAKEAKEDAEPETPAEESTDESVDESADEASTEDDLIEAPESDLAEKTRAELADLDDLEI